MTSPLFSFNSAALQSAQLSVIRLKGHEALSRPYRYDLTLLGSGPVTDGAECLNTPAALTIHNDDASRTVHGIITDFTVLHQVERSTVYQLLLEPRLKRLELSRSSRIFLSKSIPDCIVELLHEGGITSQTDYELRLQQSYPARDFVLQYNESHLQFITSRMERAGLYYFFEQGTDREKLVVTDSKLAHTAPSGARTLRYAPPANLRPEQPSETVSVLSRSSALTPSTVRIKDYNYRTPDLPVQASKTVQDQGLGEQYHYAPNVKSPSEAQQLATVRAEALAWPWLVVRGESGAPFLESGRLFSLSDHYESDWNTEYCLVETEHEGSQEGYLFSGLGQARDEALFYRVSFVAIPSEVQYRSMEGTPRPTVHGALNARIDAAGSGKYAELDEQGRYKVQLPLDRSGRKDGHASHLLRKAEPYGGAGHGMHFPLHKGTEALLIFVDGDPDRPIIAGAVPNPEHPSQVTDATQTQCRLTTAGQNKFHVEDAAGNQRMLLSTPTSESYARMGSHNDPPPDWSPSKEMAGWKLNTSKVFDVQAGSKNSVVLGNSFKCILGWEHRQTAGIRTNIVLGGNFGAKLAYVSEFAPLKNSLHSLAVRMGLSTHRVIEDKMELAEHKFTGAEHHTHAAMNQTKLAQDKNSLCLKRTRLATQQTELAQNKSQLVQQQAALAQEQTEMSTDNTHVAMSDMAVVQNRTQMVGQKMELADTRTETFQTKMSMAGDQMLLAQQASKLCDTLVEIAGEQNDM